jgi:hypothetical protein
MQPPRQVREFGPKPSTARDDAPNANKTTTGQEPRKGIAASKEEATSDGEVDSGAHDARDFGRGRRKRRRGDAQSASIAAGRQAPREEASRASERAT